VRYGGPQTFSQSCMYRFTMKTFDFLHDNVSLGRCTFIIRVAQYRVYLVCLIERCRPVGVFALTKLTLKNRAYLVTLVGLIETCRSVRVFALTKLARKEENSLLEQKSRCSQLRVHFSLSVSPVNFPQNT
jgi:hypothetical protein